MWTEETDEWVRWIAAGTKWTSSYEFARWPKVDGVVDYHNPITVPR